MRALVPDQALTSRGDLGEFLAHMRIPSIASVRKTGGPRLHSCCAIGVSPPRIDSRGSGGCRRAAADQEA